VKKENYANFQENLIQVAKMKLRKLNNEERIEDLDTTICTHIPGIRHRKIHRKIPRNFEDGR
jgi:hypothetical protein